MSVSPVCAAEEGEVAGKEEADMAAMGRDADLEPGDALELAAYHFSPSTRDRA